MCTLKFFRIFTGCFLLAATVNAIADGPRTCSYDTYTWNINLKRAVDRRTVIHSYDALEKNEIDAQTGCSVCREDQRLIGLPPLKPFYICHVFASKVRRVLAELLEAGHPIVAVVGYRVGKTRGDADTDGNRTRFSNHSFGIALDINPDQNGLYDRCLEFGPSCRLIRGGPWRPGDIPGSLASDGAVVRAFKAAGFLWGGEIAGKQKDFMHVSPSGY